jgi:hypothetical protein
MATLLLHLRAYPCIRCNGPVVSGSLGMRQSVISREINQRQIGAVCLFCGNRQSEETEPVRHFFPAEWPQPIPVVRRASYDWPQSQLASPEAREAALSRAELHSPCSRVPSWIKSDLLSGSSSLLFLDPQSRGRNGFP